MKKVFFALLFIYLNFHYSSAQMNQDYFVKNLSINQAYSDIGISFFDDDFIVFSCQDEGVVLKHSRKKRRRKKKKIQLLPQNLEFTFCALGENGMIINSQKLSSQINSEHDEIGLAFSKDQSMVYFSREIWVKDSKKKHFELFKAEVISPGSWSMIKKLPFNHPIHSLISPCLSDDDKTLYYSSNIEGDYNIYKVAILDNGDFGKSVKLSNSINTSNDEISPFVKNGKIYFSSNKSGVFNIYSKEFNNHSKAIKLEAPINSKYNDTYFIINNTKKGFFTSDRPGGKGKEDIYYFEEIIKEENIIEADNEIITTNHSIVKNNIGSSIVDEKKIITKNGIATNNIDNSAINKEKIITNKVNDTIVNTNTTIESTHLVKNKTSYDYQRQNSYDLKKEVITIFNDDGSISSNNINDEYSKCQLMFDNLGNIYFDYSESDIHKDAAVELNKVIYVMLMCPKINIVASSHTDCRASYDYNLNLSQERSSSVVKYILNNGNFESSRIIGIGYGEARLVNRCADGVKCTEKEHQMNRRTHFEISNY